MCNLLAISAMPASLFASNGGLATLIRPTQTGSRGLHCYSVTNEDQIGAPLNCEFGGSVGCATHVYTIQYCGQDVLKLSRY